MRVEVSVVGVIRISNHEYNCTAEAGGKELSLVANGGGLAQGGGSIIRGGAVRVFRRIDGSVEGDVKRSADAPSGLPSSPFKGRKH